MMRYFYWIFLLFPVWVNAQSFTDITEESGIDHQFKVLQGMFGGGACVFDLNKDGFEDLYLTSGMNEDALYLNNGDGTFSNIFRNSGLEVTNNYVTQGVAGADVDRDGWIDLFVTTISTKDTSQRIPRAENLLFLNNGDNTFRNATREFKLENLNSFSTGASFGDINLDGYPDLFVGNYFLEYDGPLNEINDATIVNASKTAKAYLLINHEGKYFTNEYEVYGMKHRGFGFGGVFTDFDNDSDIDLIVNHDFGYKAVPSYLYENNYPEPSFTNISKPSEMDLKINAMGAAVGDYNMDGLLDYFITNIRFNWFMVNQGKGEPFVNKAKELGMSYVTISWGANFADFDHDGDVDLFVANGDLNPNCQPMGDYYFENEGGTFTELGRAKGVNDYGIGRGSVIFDIENDGDMDILIINQEPTLRYPVPSKTTLYRNDSTGGNWVKVALTGTKAESHGLGSRVEVHLGDHIMLREIDGGNSSHISQNSVIAHFGLGTSTRIDSIVVKWLGGFRQTLKDQPVNTLIEVIDPRIVPKKVSAKNNGIGIYLVVAILILILFAFRRQLADQFFKVRSDK